MYSTTVTIPILIFCEHYDLLLPLFRFPMHRLEQYLTFSQSRSHFLRHVKGLSHTGHILVGKLDFFMVIQFIQKQSSVFLDLNDLSLVHFV